MLGFLFGFNARLGRLHYFLAGIVLAVLATVVCFTIAANVFHQTPKGSTPSTILMLVPALCLLPVFLWATLTLQAMRIRDIGWRPAIVIPAWVLIAAIDAYVAAKFPAWSAGRGDHQTIVGLLTNVGFYSVLLFWPSGPETGSLTGLDDPPLRRDVSPERPRVVPAPAAAVASRMPSPMRTEFGRRGA